PAARARAGWPRGRRPRRRRPRLRGRPGPVSPRPQPNRTGGARSETPRTAVGLSRRRRAWPAVVTPREARVSKEGAHGGSPVSPVLLAVTALELLARAAPAGVVAAELLGLGDDSLLRSRNRLDESLLASERACDHVGSGERLVLVREAAVPLLGLLDLLQLAGLFRLELGVEERQDDLLADRRVQLLEHLVALGG